MSKTEDKPLSKGARQALATNIEEAEQTPELEEPKAEMQPHDSAEVYSQIKGRHTLRVFPTLNSTPKGKGGTVIIAILVLLSVVSAWGVAYEVQYQLTPHVPGTCAAPAVIENGGCFTVQTSTGANGATVTTLIPAGQLKG